MGQSSSLDGKVADPFYLIVSLRADLALTPVSSGHQIDGSIIWVHVADQTLSRVTKVADAFALTWH